MTEDGPADERPTLQSVLGALDDGIGRDIVAALEEPTTASELSVRSDGHHTTEHVRAFERVSVAVAADEARDFAVTIDRPAESADERLPRLWTEVRQEA